MESEYESPSVGDTGMLIDVLSAKKLPSKYAVEKCTVDGTTLWLSDFLPEEIEALDELTT